MSIVRTFINRTTSSLVAHQRHRVPSMMLRSNTATLRFSTTAAARSIEVGEEGEEGLDLSEYVQQDSGAPLLQSQEINTTPIPQPEQQPIMQMQDAQYQNISHRRFDNEICEILMAPIDVNDVEVKPDGIIYLPEIKYRRILNRAFGPGGWAMMPRGKYVITEGYIVQEYALFCLGQFVGQAWGEQPYSEGHISGRSLATALEGAKSNALMRCCKDIGIASELWDPHFIIEWKQKYTVEVWCSHVQAGKGKRKLVRRIDREPFKYPWREEGVASDNVSTTKSKEFTPVSDDLEFPSDEINPLEIVEPTVATIDDEPFMFESLINGEVGGNVGGAEETSSSSYGGGPSFNPQNKVGFGKHKDTKWVELLSTKEGANYVNYMLKQKTLHKNLRATFEQAQKFLQTKRRP